MSRVAIIGSGPAGLTAAIYARRAGLDVLVIEKEYEGTGQIAESSQVDNYPGCPGLSGFELGEIFRQQAVDFGAQFLDGEVTALKQTGNDWQLTLADGTSIPAEAVIYAAGAAHRNLNIPGEARLTGKGISFCASCDGAFYQGKSVAVIGGGNTALDDALYLSAIADKVMLIHRRAEFRGDDLTLQKLKKLENVQIIAPAQPAAFVGEQSLTGIQLTDGRTLEVSGAFLAIGQMPQSGLLRGLVPLNESGYALVDESCTTSLPGLFVAGDVRAKALRQVVTAASDGAIAATAAANYLR